VKAVEELLPDATDPAIGMNGTFARADAESVATFDHSPGPRFASFCLAHAPEIP
jgi:hypothetical protein